MAHINNCSLRNKMHDIQQLVFSHKIRILCVTETHLDPSVPSSNLHIPNFSLIRRDRNIHGGGVCLYIHSHVHATLQSSAPSIGCLTVAIRTHSTCMSRTESIAVCCVYRPPTCGSDFWDALGQELDQVKPHSQLFVMGDLNTDVLKPTGPHFHRLQDVCDEFHLTNVVTVPTRMEKTCLDLALVPSHHHSTQVSVLSMNGISDHDLVLLNCPYLSHHVSSKPAACMYVRKPAVSKIDTTESSTHLAHEFLSLPHPSQLEEQVQAFTRSLSSTLNKFAPIKRIRVPSFHKPRPQPWVTPELKILLQRRTTLHRKLRKTLLTSRSNSNTEQ